MIRKIAGMNLIELTVVVILLGILMAVGVPRFVSFTDAANDANNQAILSQMQARAIESTKLVNDSTISEMTVSGVTAFDAASTLSSNVSLYNSMGIFLSVSGGGVNHDWNPVLALPYDNYADFVPVYAAVRSGENAAYDPTVVDSLGHYQTAQQCVTLWGMVLGEAKGVLKDELAVGLTTDDATNCTSGTCRYTANVYQCSTNSNKVGCVYTQFNSSGHATGARFFLNWYSNEIAGYSNTEDDPTWTSAPGIGCAAS